MQTVQEQDADIVVWWGSRVECVATITRLVREGHLDADGDEAARARLEQLFARATEVGPTPVLRARAERLLAIHPLSAADALQLAAALVWAREHPARLGFVCLDAQLRRAAGREGFSILPPDRHLT